MIVCLQLWSKKPVEPHVPGIKQGDSNMMEMNLL